MGDHAQARSIVAGELADVETAAAHLRTQNGRARFASAAEGNVREGRVCCRAEQNDCEMVVGADTGRAIRHRAWICLGGFHEVLQRLDLGIRRHDDCRRIIDDARDRLDAGRIVAELALHLHGQEAGSVDVGEGIAVRLGLGQSRIGDLA